MIRSDGRKLDELRPVKITIDYIKHAECSCLIEFGDTKVICTASVEEKIPPFLKGMGQGWITAEYSMLPRATATRTVRESTKGRLTGRTQEIQRLIGRSVRSAVDLRALGEITVWIDCDVIQADGGTRTASITGAFVALYRALERVGKLEAIKNFVAAVSVGIVDGEFLLDLNYEEDSMAEVDMNIVMNDAKEFVELQGTAEGKPFSKNDLDRLLAVVEKGIIELIKKQREILNY